MQGVVCAVLRHKVSYCFVHLSRAAVDALGLPTGRGATLHLQWSTPSSESACFVQFNGHTIELGGAAIEISDVFCGLNDINIESLRVSVHEGLTASVVTTTTQKVSDWALLNELSEGVQESLLSRCAVVYGGMLLPVWMDSAPGYAVLRVETAVDERGRSISPALLKADTDIEVLPPTSDGSSSRMNPACSISERDSGLWLRCHLRTSDPSFGSAALATVTTPLFERLVRASAGLPSGAPIPPRAYIALAENRLVLLLRTTEPSPDLAILGKSRKTLECEPHVAATLVSLNSDADDESCALSPGALEALCSAMLTASFRGLPAVQRAALQWQLGTDLWVTLVQMCDVTDADTLATPAVGHVDVTTEESRRSITNTLADHIASLGVVAEGAIVALETHTPALTVGCSVEEPPQVSATVIQSCRALVCRNGMCSWCMLKPLKNDCSEFATTLTKLQQKSHLEGYLRTRIRLVADVDDLPQLAGHGVECYNGFFLTHRRWSAHTDVKLLHFRETIKVEASLNSDVIAAVGDSTLHVSHHALAVRDVVRRLAHALASAAGALNGISATRCLSLLVGRSGSGRTHALGDIASQLTRLHVYVACIDCSLLAGLSLSMVCEKLVAAWLACWLRPHSVLVLDNLDVIAPHVDEASTADGAVKLDDLVATHAATISQLLLSLFSRGDSAAASVFGRRWQGQSDSPQPSRPLPLMVEAASKMLKTLAVMQVPSRVVPRFIPCIASVRSTAGLNAELRTPGAFDLIQNVPSLSTHEGRVGVLQNLAQCWPLREALGAIKAGYRFFVAAEVPWTELAVACEGYSLADISRGVHQAWSASARDVTCLEMQAVSTSLHATFAAAKECVLSADHLRDGLAAAMPANLLVAVETSRTASGIGDSSLTWDHLGGLDEAKRAISDAILLPTRYPAAYADVPVRLPSGILLYGPPGCGKTALAEAAAIHCGVRLVSVKGPELFSKYIGESEGAVRAAFQRAAAAAPCVLLLDGIDSIAPRRGAGDQSGSAGVTDRVVNQLLSVMVCVCVRVIQLVQLTLLMIRLQDGVEATLMQGVFVIGTTSRPDLIDPALLRAGRLDLSVYCPMPSPPDRWEILSRLAVRVPALSSSAARLLALLGVCEESDGCTGADLQGLLTSSVIEATRELIDSQTLTEHTSKLIVEPRHIEVAASYLRPALSQRDRSFYEAVYQAFRSSRGGAASRSQFGSRQVQA